MRELINQTLKTPMEVHRGNDFPEGYWFRITTGSNWTFNAGKTVLAYGNSEFQPFRWYNLAMAFKGDKITVLLDNNVIVTIKDTRYTHGLAGIGSDFNKVEFDDLEIK